MVGWSGNTAFYLKKQIADEAEYLEEGAELRVDSALKKGFPGC
jgi:hypothetical protein